MENNIKEQSPAEISEETLYLISQGHAAFQLLWAGVELGLFDQLSKQPGMQQKDIALSLKLAPRAARVLLTGLTSLGLVKKSGDTYKNAPVTEERLVKGNPLYGGATLGWQKYIVYPGLEDFTSALKANKNTGLEKFPGTGHTLYERLRNDPFKEKVFAEAMAGLSRQANQALMKAADFTRFNHMVDVGGGMGTNSIALAKAFPKLHATIMDNPSVCSLAQKNIEKEALTDRVNVFPGNFLTDSFPSGADLFLFSHIFSIWSEQTNRNLIQKAFEALPKKGSIAIFGMAMNDEDSGPVSVALGNPYFLAVATGDGYLYSVPDYQNWLKDAGFSKIKTISGLPMDHILMVAEKH